MEVFRPNAFVKLVLVVHDLVEAVVGSCMDFVAEVLVKIGLDLLDDVCCSPLVNLLDDVVLQNDVGPEGQM